MSAKPDTDARSRSFRRKVVYIVAIGLLLMPLFWLSQPATVGTNDAKGQPGGKLAQLRESYHLNQADLGQIDATSETIRLASLGMRGIAENILWSKANNYQMKKDWTNLRATLEQIAKLQPHSINVWRYQAWNLSYNVSVAFDDYHDKYYWVIEGIKFLKRGVDNNEQEPILPWDMGWFIAHKIGRADEALLFRKLFKADDDFHGAVPSEARDNWLVGKEWFKKSQLRINDQHPVHGMAPVIFYSDAPMCQFYYAQALETEGRFEEVAGRAWRRAAEEWDEFANFDFSTSYEIVMKLAELEIDEAKARQAVDELEKLAPGIRETIQKEKLAKLTTFERKAWDTPPEKRTDDENKIIYDVETRLTVTHEEVARRVVGPSRKQAMDLAKKAMDCETAANLVRRERSKVNFDNWKLRAEMERTKDALTARQAIYSADEAFKKGDLIVAQAKYEEGFQKWRQLLDRYPAIKEDVNIGGDLVDAIRKYQRGCLRQAEKSLPASFPLNDILEKYGKR